MCSTLWSQRYWIMIISLKRLLSFTSEDTVIQVHALFYLCVSSSLCYALLFGQDILGFHIGCTIGQDISLFGSNQDYVILLPTYLQDLLYQIYISISQLMCYSPYSRNASFISSWITISNSWSWSRCGQINNECFTVGSGHIQLVFFLGSYKIGLCAGSCYIGTNCDEQ